MINQALFSSTWYIEYRDLLFIIQFLSQMTTTSLFNVTFPCITNNRVDICEMLYFSIVNTAESDSTGFILFNTDLFIIIYFTISWVKSPQNYVFGFIVARYDTKMYSFTCCQTTSDITMCSYMINSIPILYEPFCIRIHHPKTHKQRKIMIKSR